MIELSGKWYSRWLPRLWDGKLKSSSIESSSPQIFKPLGFKFSSPQVFESSNDNGSWLIDWSLLKNVRRGGRQISLQMVRFGTFSYSQRVPQFPVQLYTIKERQSLHNAGSGAFYFLFMALLGGNNLWIWHVFSIAVFFQEFHSPNAVLSKVLLLRES